MVRVDSGHTGANHYFGMGDLSDRLEGEKEEEKEKEKEGKREQKEREGRSPPPIFDSSPPLVNRRLRSPTLLHYPASDL
ncbi:hypothetical protein ACSBR2_027696 [Camellia fascicularis]